MFTQPYLFFYLIEIEKMWKILGEKANILMRFLDTKNANLVLMNLHLYPGTAVFYYDFVQQKDEVELLRLLTYYYDTVFTYALHYYAFCEAKKESKSQRWRRLSHGLRNGYHMLELATYMNGLYKKKTEIYDLPSNMTHQKVNGYEFIWIHTPMSLTTASKHLDNCLSKVAFDNPIFGVVKHGHYVAAIEVDINTLTVVQARTKENGCIEEDKFIHDAYKKWCKINDLRIETDCEFAE
jgi:hypothetical protein